MSAAKHTPGPLVSWSEVAGGERRYDRPSPRFMRTFGGHVEIAATTTKHLRISFRDNESPSWVVYERRVVGSTRPTELSAAESEPIDEFSRFADAYAEAMRLARAAIAKARGES